MNSLDFHNEFGRQVSTLISKNYPHLLGITKEEFTDLLTPLKNKLSATPPTFPIDYEHGTLPFVIVINLKDITGEKAMPLIEREGKHGVAKLFPRTSTEFAPIASVSIPDATAYLLVDIDRGKEMLNVRPEDALQTIQKSNRFPLTIDEGIAIVTHYPDFLKKNNCFSLLASRYEGDQRVPAIWLNANKQPNLGWCWDRNPHTWLGSASCARRIGF